MTQFICLKCGYKRLPGNLECPNCGVVYHKAEAAAERLKNKTTQKESDKSAVEAVIDHCPRCGEAAFKQTKKCGRCGYDKVCFGCSMFVEQDAEDCPHCGFKIPLKKTQKAISISIYCIVAYFALSFLFMIKRPYFVQFNGEFYFAFKYLSLPIALISIWLSYKACKLIFPSRLYFFVLLSVGLTFMLLLATSLYVAPVNYYIGDHEEIALKGKIVRKKIVGGRSKSRVVEVSSDQIPENLKFMVKERYYNSVNVGDVFKKKIKKGFLGIYYIERRK
ncbi:membrane hypothetical protein [Desulfamplus magnetovallimortis]|uniref:DZANK-type domain-containing protein n=2 Tax=Desulfamplus magnetovallimortis TaxID=1246637 RepID=A0A1W1HA94_9BACT|nr:membrane hypothetical protein [Desulfamplus magnetovallimortis]